MKRIAFILSLVFICFVSCENISTDIPSTDTSLYETDTGWYFPAGTAALDIYNCLQKSTSCTGTATLTDSAILNDFYSYSDIQKRNLDKIDITVSEREPEIHTYTISIYFAYGDGISTDFNYEKNKDLPSNQKRTKNAVYTYEWQRSTTNVWKNEKIPFDLEVVI